MAKWKVKYFQWFGFCKNLAIRRDSNDNSTPSRLFTFTSYLKISLFSDFCQEIIETYMSSFKTSLKKPNGNLLAVDRRLLYGE